MSDAEVAETWRDQAIEWQQRATALTEELATTEAERDRLQSVLQNTTSEWMLRALEAERERDKLRSVVLADRRVLELGAENSRTLDDVELGRAWEHYAETHRRLDGYEIPGGS